MLNTTTESLGDALNTTTESLGDAQHREQTVLVCGGRDYSNWNELAIVLDAEHLARPFSLLIHGGAFGADAMADTWARSRGVAVSEYPADWLNDGRAAGPIRNSRMLVEGRPGRVFAFPGGRGSLDMVIKAAADHEVSLVLAIGAYGERVELQGRSWTEIRSELRAIW